jgi:hypothetical protein
VKSYTGYGYRLLDGLLLVVKHALNKCANLTRMHHYAKIRAFLPP